MRPNIVFLATYDTKGLESEYIKRKILDKGVNCITVDVGVRNISPIAADVSLEKLCDNSGHRPEDIRAMKRGEAVELVSKLADIYVSHLFQEGKADAIIGIGGAGGTQIVTQTMRTLPFGLPKLMLSTLASGNTRWYLQDSDITIIPSIADVAGLNGITEIVFSRFASIAAEAATWYRNEFPEFNRRINDKSVIRVAQTMYGTTTEGVTRARCRL
ncbi:MAG: Tm-1-like ATP-binding domain-containing protein, partial [Synergistaceae bacterium]|nr:Tm-1-like ATP-binding domain-containing protein [Synergistaceae bacterium]